MNEVRDYLFKRVFDFCLALGLLVLAAPMMLVIMLLIWWEDRSSVFFHQEVAGLKGKTFRLVRFRTLQPGVDKIWRGDDVKEDDPGTTRVGRFLLNARLDGMPVLWNVLRGEMSFVGPRPERPETAASFSRRLPRYNLRHMVRPGLVSLASVYGGENMAASHRLKYDLFYLEKMSAVWDARLLMVAAWQAVKGRVGLGEEENEESGSA